ncbi:hypothetical protein QUA70_10390 [Microcoleus sp. LAD1_D5]
MPVHKKLIENGATSQLIWLTNIKRLSALSLNPVNCRDKVDKEDKQHKDFKGFKHFKILKETSKYLF